MNIPGRQKICSPEAQSSIGKTSWQGAKEPDLLVNPGLSGELGQITSRVLSKTNHGTNTK